MELHPIVQSLLPSLFQPTVGALSKGGMMPLFGKEGRGEIFELLQIHYELLNT
jgi:hypothetical protein